MYFVHALFFLNALLCNCHNRKIWKPIAPTILHFDVYQMQIARNQRTTATTIYIVINPIGFISPYPKVKAPLIYIVKLVVAKLAIK